MHSSRHKVGKQTNSCLISLVRTFSGIINGPAKSAPVKLNAGSSFILLTGKRGGGGVGNGAPSNLRQVTQRCMIGRIKLRHFIIQNLLLISVKVSRTPLCSTHLFRPCLLTPTSGGNKSHGIAIDTDSVAIRATTQLLTPTSVPSFLSHCPLPDYDVA